ncbi:MAG: hypothetical protein SFU98_12360 [Leptospiraceae bacterium]|nr:hypothetical protein [Leptospiraceae bacterium]
MCSFFTRKENDSFLALTNYMEETLVIEKEISAKALDLLLDVENYKTPYAKSVADPYDLILDIAKKVSLQTGFVSGMLSLPSGYFGYATILPEIFFLLKMQARMVKDIAALYGKEKLITKEILLYCIFKRNQISLLERTIKISSTRALVRPMTVNLFLKFLEKYIVGIKFSKKLTRFLPLLGFLSSGIISFVDTKVVALTASNLFSKEILLTEENEIS